MNVIFVDKDLEELYRFGRNGKYKKYSRDKIFMKNLVGVIDVLFSSFSTKELKQISSLHYEQLKYIGKSSVRVMNGRVERIVFTENESGIEIEIIELNQTHYGKKK